MSYFPFILPSGMENGIFDGMNMDVQIDSAGRVVLPKKVRERFRLHGGDRLILEIRGDAIQLRPQQSTARWERVNGVLVLVSETSLPEGRDFVSESREERIEEIARRATEAE
jgi:AbrB family looped-hinge helix DNA binding protein